MQLFYSPTLKEEDSHFCFDKNESRHIIKVLRKKSGDKLFITNGVGCFFESEISIPNSNKCEVKILNVSKKKRKDFKIHLAVAPTKLNDRFEWFLEKATEIGIDEITPIFCTNAERKIVKPERYEKIIQAAAKQSLKVYFPKLNPAVKFIEFIQNRNVSNQYIAHCMDVEKPYLKSELIIGQDALVLIGPEGDFTIKEIELAEQMGFKSISLGDSRLRTETAALVACHTIQMCNV